MSGGLRAVAGLLCAVLVAACGSTVRQGGTAAEVPGVTADADGSGPVLAGADGLGPAPGGSSVGPAGSSSGASGAAAGGGGVGAPAARPGSSGPQAAPGPAAQGTGSAAAPAPPGQPAPSGGPAAAARPASVPGVDDDHVYVGVRYIDAAAFGAYGNALGVEGIGSTSQLRAYEVLVDLVNADGGVAGGRELVIVPNQVDLAADRDADEQRACEAFTSDTRVLLANMAYAGQAPGVPCLVERGVMTVGAGVAEGGSQADFQAFGGLYQGPGMADVVTAADAYVEALVRQGVLTSGSTVGLLWFDFPAYAAAREEGIIPALARHGLEVAVEFRSDNPTSRSEIGRVATEMQSASLQFRTEGVDVVLALDLNASLMYLFMTASEQQGYRPRYGVATWTQPNFLRLNAPAAQLAGASGIGWMPSNDVDDAQLPRLEPHERCEQIMRDAGMPVTAYADRVLQHSACATVFFWEAVLDTATDLSPAGLSAAAAQVQGLPSSTGFAAETFGPDKRWGAAAYRDLLWDTGCGCFAYSGPDRSF